MVLAFAGLSTTTRFMRGGGLRRARKGGGTWLARASLSIGPTTRRDSGGGSERCEASRQQGCAPCEAQLQQGGGDGADGRVSGVGQLVPRGRRRREQRRDALDQGRVGPCGRAFKGLVHRWLAQGAQGG